jgi:hypothetical protein
MEMQLKRYAFLAVALVLLAAMACRQVKQPVEKPIEKPPLDSCYAAEKYIEAAQAITSDLEDLNWSEFSEIGIVCPPRGMCSVSTVPIVEKKSVTGEALTRWTSVAALLPSPQTVKIYRLQCDNCLKLANEVCLFELLQNPPDHRASGIPVMLRKVGDGFAASVLSLEVTYSDGAVQVQFPKN